LGAGALAEDRLTTNYTYLHLDMGNKKRRENKHVQAQSKLQDIQMRLTVNPGYQVAVRIYQLAMLESNVHHLKIMMLFGLASCAVASQSQCSGDIHPSCGGGGKGIYSNTTVADYSACCAACIADPKCKSWTYTIKKPKNYNATNGECNLRTEADNIGKPEKPNKISGSAPGAPTPPPTPRPVPPPAPAGSQKNIIFVLTDDQDLRLGSMIALPRDRDSARERVLGRMREREREGMREGQTEKEEARG
jgi:hypothetical protein